MRFVGPLLLLEFFPLSQLMLVLCTKDNWSTQDGMWRCVWHWDGPERIRMFIWLLIQQRILTNAERVRRHLTLDASCHVCGGTVETALHVVRDC